MQKDNDIIDLGKCCICEADNDTVRNLFELPYESPVSGRGWGCLVCKLEKTGAIAVVCDDCIDIAKQNAFKFICAGNDGKSRIAYTDFIKTAKRLEHRIQLHEYQEISDKPDSYYAGVDEILAEYMKPLPTDRWYPADEPEGNPHICSRCESEIGDDEVPILIWDDDSNMIVLCVNCISKVKNN